MRRVRRVAPAPPDLGTDVVAVPEGADLELDLRLEAVMEGVLVTGSVRGPVVGECVRCLGDVRSDLDVDLTELYAYPDRAPAGVDDDVRGLEGDLIDLEPAVRDAVVIALPFQPVCREDCPGLCSECGARLADEPGHRHQTADPRWAALQGILAEGVNDGVPGPGSSGDEKEN